jgi:hypothetical protein
MHEGASTAMFRLLQLQLLLLLLCVMVVSSAVAAAASSGNDSSCQCLQQADVAVTAHSHWQSSESIRLAAHREAQVRQ